MVCWATSLIINNLATDTKHVKSDTNNVIIILQAHDYSTDGNLRAETLLAAITGHKNKHTIARLAT